MTNQQYPDYSIGSLGEKLKSLGFANLFDYLEKNKKKGYQSIASELKIPAIIIIREHIKDCRRIGKLRNGIIDSFIREIHENYPEGWDPSNEKKRIIFISGWLSEMVVTGELMHLRNQLRAFLDNIKINAKPGWLPDGIDDEVLIKSIHFLDEP